MKTFKDYQFIITVLTAVVLYILVPSCKQLNDPDAPGKSDFQISAKYDSIRSYKNGGGIFVLKVSATSAFSGKVQLNIESDAALNAHLSKSEISNPDSVFDITIAPTSQADASLYSIKVTASSGSIVRTKEIKVRIYEWSENLEDATKKLLEFRPWILQYAKSYDTVFSVQDDVYSTYPETLVVEHYTYLTSKYEVRLCYHVMFPPDDWSMLWIRNRNNYEPEFVLRRNTDASINVKSVSDYPIMYGY